jgi:DNA-binding IclR family transcriptional regulator
VAGPAGARRALAVLRAFSPGQPVLTAGELAAESGQKALVARVPVCLHHAGPGRPGTVFAAGQVLPLRGATGLVLLAGLDERARREHLVPLAWAASADEGERGSWTVSAPVTDGPVTVAALTVAARSADAARDRLPGRVQAAAVRLSDTITQVKLP